MARLNGMILALLLSAAVPAAVLAQPKPEEAKKHAPAAKPAPHAAPAARPAPHPAPAARPAPAPHPVVRAAPHVAPHAAPHPVVRAAPRPAPHPAARATPRVAPRQAARPEPRHAPSNARIIRREERRVQRQERHAPKVTEAPKAAPQKGAPAQAAAPQKAAPTAAAAAKTAAPARTLTRAERRQERTLRRQEDRSVRRLPPSQRAARREEIKHAREERVLKRQQTATPAVQAQPSAQVQRSAQQAVQQNSQRQGRRNGRQRVAAQDARNGRFAASFAQQPAATTAVQRQARHDRWSAREAWRHRARAPFIVWYGPVFWPYAYTDVFDYTFWPDGYDDGYWAYAYDDFVDGLFWGEEGPPAEYAYAPEVTGSSPASSAPAPVRYASVQQLCMQPGSGVTAWPIAEIEKKVGLNAEQKDLLAGMRRDAAKAADVFKASCPAENAFPLTPPGRLAAMTGRLQATLEAVDTVKPALDRFYNSLSDEQKERFNKIGPKPKAETTAKASADTAQSCKQPKPGLANLPIEKIEDAVKPTAAQADDLDKLQDATDKAVGILQAACPDQTPLTPPGRLDAMETRLKAMIEAANTVKPALDGFYASLSNEQKAQFNRMGRELATAND